MFFCLSPKTMSNPAITNSEVPIAIQPGHSVPKSHLNISFYSYLGKALALFSLDVIKKFFFTVQVSFSDYNSYSTSVHHSL